MCTQGFGATSIRQPRPHLPNRSRNWIEAYVIALLVEDAHICESLWESALSSSRLTLESDWFSTWCQILYTIISSWERLIGDWFSLSLAMRDKTLFTSLLFSALMAERTMKSNILSSSRISKRKSCVIRTHILILLSESNDFVICASGSLLRKGRGWRTAGLSWSWDASSRLRESWTATGPGSTEQVGSVSGS